MRALALELLVTYDDRGGGSGGVPAAGGGPAGAGLARAAVSPLAQGRLVGRTRHGGWWFCGDGALNLAEQELRDAATRWELQHTAARPHGMHIGVEGNAVPSSTLLPPTSFLS